MVVSGAKARYRGLGTVNGTGSFGFELTAWDGQPNGGDGTDRFRIKIWNNNQGNGVVYDNLLGAADESDPTAIGGGSIVIHKGSQAVLASGGVAIDSDGGSLSQESLDQAVDQAINYWRNTGIDAETVSNLQQVRVELANLSETALGIASDTNYVWIDRDAAGYGWQLDAMGASSLSFNGGMDLLSVVAHELGHKLGLEHGDDDRDLMAPTLRAGERRLLGDLGQSMAFLGTNWSIPESLRLDVVRHGSWGTLRLRAEDMKVIQAHDQLFAKLDVASTKSGLRGPRITQDTVPDSRQIPYALDEDLLEEDLVEAIAKAHLASRL